MAQKIITMTPVNNVPAIKSIKPCGTQVLVELLTAQEALGTNLIIDGDSSTIKNGAPQGYVIDIGPRVASDHGFKIGDRVTLNGNYTPLPEVSSLSSSTGKEKNSDRPWILIEPQQIKAVLSE
jgi:co-chaperonin GroES (HSP10)